MYYSYSFVCRCQAVVLIHKAHFSPVANILDSLICSVFCALIRCMAFIKNTNE